MGPLGSAGRGGLTGNRKEELREARLCKGPEVCKSGPGVQGRGDSGSTRVGQVGRGVMQRLRLPEVGS